MAVSILTITHRNVGHELLATIKSMMGNALPLTCRALSVTDASNPDEVLKKAITICKQLDVDDGVLVLTDIFGSTPSNICNKIRSASTVKVHVIAGLNLPMLIRILNYPDLPLDELIDKALSGAHDGIIDCREEASHE